MPPPEKGKVCFAPTAGLLLWLAVPVMSANTMPAQQEAPYRAWKLATEAASTGSQAGPACDPAAGMEPSNLTLAGGAAKPDPPVELWPDARPYPFHLPPHPRRAPLRIVQTAVWMLLGVASTVLAGTDNRHHRRRAHAGCRHARAGFPTKKPRPPLRKGESAAVAGAGRARPAFLSSPSRVRDRPDRRLEPISSRGFQPPLLRW